MPCFRIEHGYVCDFAEYRNYICFEHTTYLFEFSRRFGPYWFRIECGREIDTPQPQPDGHMAILWEMFEKWYYPETI